MPVAFATAVIIGSFVSSFLLGLILWLCFVFFCEPHKADLASRRPELWTIHNKRYDLNGWLNHHPGGRVMILLGKGRNCTEMFESYHSLSEPGLVKKVLAQFYVEDVAPDDLDFDDTFDWDNTPFYDAIKARVRQYFKETKQSCKAGAAQRLQLGTFVVATAALYWVYIKGSWAAAVLLPLCYWLGPSGCMHDGAHASIVDNIPLNNAIAYLGSAHMSIMSWNQQHTIGHHTHTNLSDRDPDLYHFSFNAREGIPGYRTSTSLKPMPATVAAIPRHVYWRAGLLLRSFLTTLGPSYIWDFISLTALNQTYLGIVPYTTLTPTRMLVHIFGRIIVAWLCFTLPFVSMSLSSGLTRAFAFAILPYLIHGFIFYMFSQVSHVQAVCFPPANRQGDLKRKSEWAVHQVEHTLDYATTSRLWLHLAGGLNNQVIHHLFPQVGWDHYDKLAPIAEKLCRDFHVNYHTVPTFSDALVAHVQYLQSINDSSDYTAPSPRFLTKERLKLLGEL